MPRFPQVIAVSGSHRDNANTEAMLLACVSELKKQKISVELIVLRNLSFEPTDACAICDDDNPPHFKDELQWLLPKIISADGWIIATPEYWWGVSGHCKQFLDRLTPYWRKREKYFWGKKTAIITCGGQPLERTGYAEAHLELFFEKMKMPLIGKVRASAEAPEEILQQPGVLNECRKLGKKMAEELRKKPKIKIK